MEEITALTTNEFSSNDKNEFNRLFITGFTWSIETSEPSNAMKKGWMNQITHLSYMSSKHSRNAITSVLPFLIDPVIALNKNDWLLLKNSEEIPTIYGPLEIGYKGITIISPHGYRSKKVSLKQFNFFSMLEKLKQQSIYEAYLKNPPPRLEASFEGEYIFNIVKQIEALQEEKGFHPYQLLSMHEHVLPQIECMDEYINLIFSVIHHGVIPFSLVIHRNSSRMTNQIDKNDDETFYSSTMQPWFQWFEGFIFYEDIQKIKMIMDAQEETHKEIEEPSPINDCQIDLIDEIIKQMTTLVERIDDLEIKMSSLERKFNRSLKNINGKIDILMDKIN